MVNQLSSNSNLNKPKSFVIKENSNLNLNDIPLQCLNSHPERQEVLKVRLCTRDAFSSESSRSDESAQENNHDQDNDYLQNANILYLSPRNPNGMSEFSNCLDKRYINHIPFFCKNQNQLISISKPTVNSSGRSYQKNKDQLNPSAQMEEM